MVVNGLQLPASFLQFWQAMHKGEQPDKWVLKENVDAYGHPWETGLEVYWDPKTMEQETAELPKRFVMDDADKINASCADEPGSIPFITDFSKIVCFGETAGGEVFCFDFREDPKEPGVIYWEGCWRRVAPNFQAFMALFEPHDFDKAVEELRADGLL